MERTTVLRWKGQGGRWRHHAKYGSRLRNTNFARIFLKAESLNLHVPCVKIRENLTEREAFELESILISVLGRKETGGPLVNLTDGGEGSSGHTVPDKLRMKLSDDAQKRWKDPVLGPKMALINKGRKATPETKKLLSEFQKKRLSNPNERLKHRSNKPRKPFSEETKKKMQESALRRCSKPEEREKISQRAKLVWSTPEGREKRSQLAKSAWADPIKGARMLAATKSVHNDPTFKLKHAEGQKRRRLREKSTEGIT